MFLLERSKSGEQLDGHSNVEANKDFGEAGEHYK